MKRLLVGVLAFTGTAFAAHLAPATYHDGTLVAFPSQASASNCASGAKHFCSDDYQAQYMVQSEGILYALSPASASTGSTIFERAMLGWRKAFTRNDSLYRQQPGTPILVRDDGRHLFVRVGNHESEYMAVEAR
jgi:hypothetical protein